MKFYHFLTYGVSGVNNFIYAYSGFFVVSVFCSLWFRGSFMVFNLWVDPGFILLEFAA
jgi:hypothetical protein